MVGYGEIAGMALSVTEQGPDYWRAERCMASHRSPPALMILAPTMTTQNRMLMSDIPTSLVMHYHHGEYRRENRCQYQHDAAQL